MLFFTVQVPEEYYVNWEDLEWNFLVLPDMAAFAELL